MVTPTSRLSFRHAVWGQCGPPAMGSRGAPFLSPASSLGSSHPMLSNMWKRNTLRCRVTRW